MCSLVLCRTLHRRPDFCVLCCCVADGPKITQCIAAQIGLREAADLARHRKAFLDIAQRGRHLGISLDSLSACVSNVAVQPASFSDPAGNHALLHDCQRRNLLPRPRRTCMPRTKRASTPPPMARSTTAIAEAMRCNIMNFQQSVFILRERTPLCPLFRATCFNG